MTFMLPYSILCICKKVSLIKKGNKMSDCTPISQEEFETYLTIKKFIERNGFEEVDLRNMVQAGPPLIIHSDDIEPKRYECLSDAADDIKISKQTLLFVHEKKRPLITRRKGGAKIFYIKWLED